MDLTDFHTLSSILKSNGFEFKKSLGQNFLIDPLVCPQMAQLCQCENQGVIEIGPGAGVLTQQLARLAKKVVCIEVDQNLKKVLHTTLADFDNVKVIFGDCMKLDIAKIIEEELGGMDVVICANLPYYLTSPIIMSLLERELPVQNITVMIQKEAAVRLCSRLGERTCSSVTAAVRYYADPELLFEVKRDSFYPAPKVDSQVIRLNIKKSKGFGEQNKDAFFRLIHAAFSMRRKTMINCLTKNMGLEKETLIQWFESIGISPTARAEAVTQEQFVALSNYLNERGI